MLFHSANHLTNILWIKTCFVIPCIWIIHVMANHVIFLYFSDWIWLIKPHLGAWQWVIKNWRIYIFKLIYNASDMNDFEYSFFHSNHYGKWGSWFSFSTWRKLWDDYIYLLTFDYLRFVYHPVLDKPGHLQNYLSTEPRWNVVLTYYCCGSTCGFLFSCDLWLGFKDPIVIRVNRVEIHSLLMKWKI